MWIGTSLDEYFILLVRREMLMVSWFQVTVKQIAQQQSKYGNNLSRKLYCKNIILWKLHYATCLRSGQKNSKLTWSTCENIKRLPLDLLGHCLLVTLTRKSSPELFYKKKIFKTLLNSQENSYVGVTFLMKLQNL